MKRARYIALILAVVMTVCVFVFNPVSASRIKADSKKADPAKIAAAKIENMLNINNVFGDDFTDNEALVNLAAINLLDYADDEGFIPEAKIVSFIKDMYDIDVVITDDINSDFPKKDGFVYLIPRGYTVFTHDIISIEYNGDVITVISNVSARFHDGFENIGTAETILQKNPASAFGFNILNCELKTVTAASNA